MLLCPWPSPHSPCYTNYQTTVLLPPQFMKDHQNMLVMELCQTTRISHDFSLDAFVIGSVFDELRRENISDNFNKFRSPGGL